MRILRLASSDEAPGRLPIGASIPELVASLVEQATGEPVEVTLKAAWPNAALPGRIDSWIDEYRPDVVSLKVNAYWFNYLSLPLQVERKFGRVGKPINKTGKRIGELRPVASSSAFRITRRYLLRLLPGATYFTPEAVVASMQEAVRTILAHEGIGLVVSGPASRLNHELSRSAAQAHEARRQRVHQAMKRLCAEVHVPYLGMDSVPTKAALADTVLGDGIHVNETASLEMAQREAAVLTNLWKTDLGLSESDPMD